MYRAREDDHEFNKMSGLYDHRHIYSSGWWCPMSRQILKITISMGEPPLHDAGPTPHKDTQTAPLAPFFWVLPAWTTRNINSTGVCCSEAIYSIRLILLHWPWPESILSCTYPGCKPLCDILVRITKGTRNPTSLLSTLLNTSPCNHKA